MIRRLVGALIAFGAAGNSALAETPRYDFDDRSFDQVTAEQLETFRSERDFRRYIERVSELRRERRERVQEQELRQFRQQLRRSGLQHHGLMRASYQEDATPSVSEEDVCPPDDPTCGAENTAPVVVTGSRVSGPPATITNVQSVGVDEGDIVKQIGRFLLVMQDGRIFSIDTGGEEGPLDLVDRIDVYRSEPEAADWYDEMLVQEDRVIVAAYSYREAATELSIFRLDRETGHLSRDGVFFISSDDYYSADNYATRIIGDQLIIYTPYRLSPFEDESKWPVVRRWTGEGEFDAERENGTRLFDARNIYRPVQRTAEPWIHSVSMCPLGDIQDRANLECRTTAFVGPEDGVFFVSPEAVFVWLVPWEDVFENLLSYRNFRNYRAYSDYWRTRQEAMERHCDTAGRAPRRDILPSAVFRIPVNGRNPGVIGTRGAPIDQFSMDARDGVFRALTAWLPSACIENWEMPLDVSFLEAPISAFGNAIDRRRDARYTPLPPTGTHVIENRFADNYLVYGGRQTWNSRPPYRDTSDPDELEPVTSRVVTVPVRNPEEAVVIELPHNIVRTERVGNNMMLNGYRDDSGLNMTLLELGDQPRIASTIYLAQRFESEGRSHAFNSIVEEDGSGLIGVPTVFREEESSRLPWRSDSSDVSYLTMASDMSLAHAGELSMSSEDPTHETYDCDVSCTDWYGNSRPIFTMGRIFGLMGIELVEGKVEAGRMVEVRRLNLTQTPTED